MCIIHYLKEMSTASEQRSLQLEIEMMKELGSHRHLVSMLAWCLQGNRLALVMEYVHGGNLHQFLRNQRNKVNFFTVRLLLKTLSELRQQSMHTHPTLYTE